MNRLQFILTAKSQYDIQSPFLYGLYSDVLNSSLSDEERERQGIAVGDRYAELRYMLGDHYAAVPVAVGGWFADDMLSSSEVGLIGMVRCPHGDSRRESAWASLVRNEAVSLSVDLYDIGIFFICNRLSKQNIMLRII